jgi:agmatine deiminase
MITDIQTNKLFLADCLPIKQPRFFNRFAEVLKDCNIHFRFLPYTKDIWAVDFIPIQISTDEFVQFTYNPDYLQAQKYRSTISDVDRICEAIKLPTTKSKLVVDGGNVIRATTQVIMCDKVFNENKHISERDLIKQLKELFLVDKLFFIPWDKDDFIGHADGMVRFIDDKTVLINNYTLEEPSFQRSLRMAIHNAGLEWIELPYSPPKNTNIDCADGLYLNYLQMQHAIIMPTFNCKDDENAYKVFEKVFKGQTIVTVDSKEIAKDGGVLNCITWNIVE